MKGKDRGRTIVSVAILLGCVGSDMDGTGDPERISIVERDSSGIRIVETSRWVLDSPLAWQIGLDPEVEIGAPSGDPSSQFHSTAGILGLDGGTILVMDGATQELRWFDPHGEHVRSFGGAGSGPGEFRRARLVPGFPRDSVLVYDRRSFTKIAADGSGYRTLSSSEAFFGTPRAVLGSHVLFTSATGTLCQVNEPCDGPIMLRRIDLAGTSADTLATFSGSNIRYLEPGKPPVLMLNPFQQVNVAAAGMNGFITEGNPLFELKQLDENGVLKGIFRVESSPLYSIEDALEAELSQFGPDDPNYREAFEMMGLPDVIPAYDALIADHLGWTWAKLFVPGADSPPKWVVFDESGRGHGTIETPADLEVFDIGVDYILGRSTDENDVQYVRRYRLDRGTE